MCAVRKQSQGTSSACCCTHSPQPCCPSTACGFCASTSSRFVFFSYVLCFGTAGRPKGVKEQDVYICDYRLDKSAHLFYKIHRNRYPVCTKPYAFDHFPKRLTPKRDFSVSVLTASLLVCVFLRGPWLCLCTKHTANLQELTHKYTEWMEIWLETKHRKKK